MKAGGSERGLITENYYLGWVNFGRLWWVNFQRRLTAITEYIATKGSLLDRNVVFEERLDVTFNA